jgi:hypothetical protein
MELYVAWIFVGTYVFASMCACAHEDVYVSMCACAHEDVYVSMCACAHEEDVYVSMCACAHEDVYVSMCACACVYSLVSPVACPRKGGMLPSKFFFDKSLQQ